MVLHNTEQSSYTGVFYMNKRKKSKLGLIIVLAIMAYFAYTFINQQGILMGKRAQLNSLNDKYKTELKLNNDLNKKKGSTNNRQYVEDVARQQLDMVKKDERVFVDVNK
jgi:cell division protein FtsB